MSELVIRIRHDERDLMNLGPLAVLMQRSPHTIRARCPVYARVQDETTGRWHNLYDVDACWDIMDNITPRRRAAA